MIPPNNIFDQADARREELARDWADANGTSTEIGQPNWGAVILVGVVFFTLGILLAGVSEGGSVVFIFIGIIIIIGALASGKLETEMESWDSPPEDVTYDDSPLDTLNYDMYRQGLRQEEIDEIVKKVKATIKVRCRYCGTLNEEKAGSCESCGAPM